MSNQNQENAKIDQINEDQKPKEEEQPLTYDKQSILDFNNFLQQQDFKDGTYKNIYNKLQEIRKNFQQQNNDKLLQELQKQSKQIQNASNKKKIFIADQRGLQDYFKLSNIFQEKPEKNEQKQIPNNIDPQIFSQPKNYLDNNINKHYFKDGLVQYKEKYQMVQYGQQTQQEQQESNQLQNISQQNNQSQQNQQRLQQFQEQQQKYFDQQQKQYQQSQQIQPTQNLQNQQSSKVQQNSQRSNANQEFKQIAENSKNLRIQKQNLLDWSIQG